MKDIEATLAWDDVVEYLREFGVDRKNAPPLPPQIEYALRRVGGLQAVSEAKGERRGLLVEEFVQALHEAPVVDSDQDQLQAGETIRRMWKAAKRLKEGA
jgi:hypothetical protein